MGKVIDIKRLKKELPHGSIGIISERSGIGRQTISRVMKGETRCKQYTEAIKAIAEFAAEFKAKEAEAMQELSQAVSPQLKDAI